jgi:methylmalonyl-CoA/ethylmalonyl-CoA epimerase
MKLGRLNHIGIATPSIADGIILYRNVMCPCIRSCKTL